MEAALLARLDARLLAGPGAAVAGWRRWALELLFFGLKQARACLFAGLFFVGLLVIPQGGWLGLARYDLLLGWAVLLHAWMLWRRLESWDEARAIAVFHLLGFALEAFKTHPAIGSWSYPGPGLTKILGVPLFAGFMYAAVGSYMIQAWRLLRLEVTRHPPYWMTWLLAALIYLNFFSHHFVGDYRQHLAALGLGLYARTVVRFTPLDRPRAMPLLLGFVLIGLFIWLAENFSTFHAVWLYPHQLGAWSGVHLAKWSSWSLLVVMTFAIVTNLKQVKRRIALAP